MRALVRSSAFRLLFRTDKLKLELQTAFAFGRKEDLGELLGVSPA